VVRGHRSLKGSSVEVERSAFGYIAETGKLGTAVHPALSSYIDRTISVDAPDAPVTAELGQGSFRAFPPYRSGYLLTVGSANNVTAVGRLLDNQGQPLSLVSGSARFVGQSSDEPVALFTNRDGRFGATGLASGRWQVTMNDDSGSVFMIIVPKDAEGILTLGDLKPAAAATPQESR
jgi:outer membrane usher protein